MNSPKAYSVANAGSRIDGLLVSPIHGLDRTSIDVSTFSIDFSPLKNPVVQEKLNRYHSISALIDIAKNQSKNDTPSKSSECPLTSPKSVRRRRQSLLVFEALDSITTVSKTPTKVKIRNSSAFLGSSTKMRVETSLKEAVPAKNKNTDALQDVTRPTATSAQEVWQLLGEYVARGNTTSYSLLGARESDVVVATPDTISVTLACCAAEDIELLAGMKTRTHSSPAPSDAAIERQRQRTPLQPNPNIPVQSSDISMELFKTDAAAPVMRHSSTTPHSKLTPSPLTCPKTVVAPNETRLLIIGNENLSHNIPEETPLSVSTTYPTTPSSGKRSSRFNNVLNSCSKVLQEMDNMMLCQ